MVWIGAVLRHRAGACRSAVDVESGSPAAVPGWVGERPARQHRGEDRVSINGVEHGMFIKGRSRSNPVLLCWRPGHA